MAAGLLVTCWFAAQPLFAFEKLTVKDTSYAIPPGALFVSTTGNDANPGTEAQPVRTLGQAVTLAGSGDTIVLREGTYREDEVTISRPLTLQPYPHEEVWIKGSVVVTGWVQDGSRWRKDGWTVEFDQDTYSAGAFQPGFPHAGKPDQVFIDGDPLDQVGSVGEVGAGEFYVDYGANRLTIGDNPNGKTVEASAYERSIRAFSGADGSLIRGLGFAHYAGDRFQGTLQCDGAVVTFENNTIGWAASRAIAVYNGGAIVRGNTLIYNGQMGLAVWQSTGVRVEQNRIAANNQERFVMHGGVAEAAGSKITVSTELVIRDNVFEDNLSQGLWLDISIYDATIVRNIARNNSSFGIFFEISANAIIAGNLAVGNVDVGIAASNASDVKIWNNTLVNNGQHLAIFDDDRVNDDPDEVAQGITYITDDVEIMNNLLAGSLGGSEAFLFARDYTSSPRKDADDMISLCDHNGYHRANSAVPSTQFEWWRGTTINNYANVAAFQSATGFEPDGIAFDDVPDPFFVSPATGDYTLQPGSAARNAGAPLPADVAQALGLPAGETVDLGAFQFSGMFSDGFESGDTSAWTTTEP